MSIDWIDRARSLKLQVRNFVNGHWVPVTGKPLAKHNPRDGRLLCSFGAGAASEVDDAVSVARASFADGRWSRMPVQRRKQVLHDLSLLIEKHREELALLESMDVGKPIRDALSFDVPATASTIRFCAEALDKLVGKVYGVDRSSLSYQLLRPYGVVGGIIGWNFPLLLAASKAGPALAAGNSLVLKPSELTSFSAGRLAELAMEAGMPEGVFNVVHGGSDIGASLAKHLEVDLVTFTGSTQTGKKLLLAAGSSNIKPMILECGGKAPSIVFDDAPDLEAVVEGILARAFWNQGQVCTASSRLLVQESIKEEIQRLLIKKAIARTPGDPLLSETLFGALVSREHQRKVLSYIESGEREGASKVFQSASPPPFHEGFYTGPVIFDDVVPGQTIAQEEIFGPVLSVMTFRDEEEAVRIANSTIYGLSAVLWTRDLGRAHRMVQEVKAGWIVVNATAQPTGGPGEGTLPVGGQKQSGIGVEGGLEGIEAYMSKSAVQLFI